MLPVYSADAANEKRLAIAEQMMQRSVHVRSRQFNRLGVSDLAMLFCLYDTHFFGGTLAPLVQQHSVAPLRFRVSNTMTNAGGKTYQHRRRVPGLAGILPSKRYEYRYEIGVSARLLMMSFNDTHRPIVVCGGTCSDRLTALQRIFEHEITHLVELVLWNKSSCKASRFHRIVGQVFGHRGYVHDMITPAEDAAVRHGIVIGQTVAFLHEGGELVGKVNRINRRATVLVNDPRGVRYSDGGRYAKFYVPLERLRPAKN